MSTGSDSDDEGYAIQQNNIKTKTWYESGSDSGSESVSEIAESKDAQGSDTETLSGGSGNGLQESGSDDDSSDGERSSNHSEIDRHSNSHREVRDDRLDNKNCGKPPGRRRGRS